MPDAANAPATPKVTGYRQLTEAEIALMNTIKAREAELAELLTSIRGAAPVGEPQRQAALAATAFEEGFMRLVRVVARPVSPWVRTDVR